MKVFLRILVILITLAVMVIALWPPEKTSQTAAKSPAPPSEKPTAKPSASQNAIKDLLGGAAIESGKKAKNIISDVNKETQKEINDMNDMEW